MEELQEAYSEWSSFVGLREEARAEAQGSIDSTLHDDLREANLNLAQLKAEIYSIKAQILMNKGTYNKQAFDAEWSAKKIRLKQRVEELIAAELSKGKNPNQLATELGSKSLNMFYGIKANIDSYRAEASKELEGINWQWSRFTGTQRYAVGLAGEETYVLMKGTIDTELEGLECVWNYATGAFISGSLEVYNSDSETNRARRAVTLAEILEGTYTGTVKERKNPYFEEID